MQIIAEFEQIPDVFAGVTTALLDGKATIYVDGDYVEITEIEIPSVLRDQPGLVIKPPAPLQRGRAADIFRAVEDQLRPFHHEYIQSAANARADSRADRQMAMAS